MMTGKKPKAPCMPPTSEIALYALYFRDALRGARDAAQRDSEGYQQIMFVIERLGGQLWPDKQTLGGFEKGFNILVKKHHPLNGKCADKKECAGENGVSFEKCYEIVREGRNQAMHIGAVARNLTSHCVKLSIILEDTLRSIAKQWQTRSKITWSATRNAPMSGSGSA